MFIGANLTNARIIHGLTRKQLSAKLEVTEQAVWQYENGFASPKMETVNKLKMILSVKSNYFYKADLLLSKQKVNMVNPNHIAYRSSVINSVQKTQFEAAHIRNLIAFMELIMEKLHFPENRLRELRENVIERLGNEENRMTWVHKAAQYARDFLDMSNNSNRNLLFSLEKSGAFIFEKAIGDKIDAYSFWSADETPYIMLGNFKKSAVRRNFDLAHELGHLLLHYKVEFALLDKKSHREYEHEANVFAGSFLLPENEFNTDFRTIAKVSHPDSYIEFKKKWTVSIQTMAYRAHSLHLISYQQYRYFNIMLNRLNYKEVEPLDRQLSVPQPGKVKSIFQLLFEKKYVSLNELLDLLGADIELLTKLTGIETNYFKQYQYQSARQFSIEDLKFKAE